MKIRAIIWFSVFNGLGLLNRLIPYYKPFIVDETFAGFISGLLYLLVFLVPLICYLKKDLED